MENNSLKNESTIHQENKHKTLEVMKKIKSWEYVTNLGKKVKKEWAKLSKKYDLPIIINGIDHRLNITR